MFCMKYCWPLVTFCLHAVSVCITLFVHDMLWWSYCIAIFDSNNDHNSVVTNHKTKWFVTEVWGCTKGAFPLSRRLGYDNPRCARIWQSPKIVSCCEYGRLLTAGQEQAVVGCRGIKPRWKSDLRFQNLVQQNRGVSKFANFVAVYPAHSPPLLSTGRHQLASQAPRQRRLKPVVVSDICKRRPSEDKPAVTKRWPPVKITLIIHWNMATLCNNSPKTTYNSSRIFFF